MDIHVSLAGRGDLSARIYRQLLEAIVDGRLRSGERLPPSRELARQLAVSRNTVGVAYERLGAEGFLVGRVGAGTYVSTEPLTRVRGRRAPGGRGVNPRRIWKQLPEPVPLPAETAPYDFSVGVPDLRLFPWETWRRLISHELRLTSVHSGDYGDPAGHAGLRAAVARHIGISRSVRAAPDDVLVTHGAQQALDLIGRVLIEPGMNVGVEEPGYRPARALFASLGAKVVSVPVDDEGLDAAAIPRIGPSGVRDAITSLPDGYGDVIDQTDRVARLGRPATTLSSSRTTTTASSATPIVPLDPLQSLDRGGRVIYVGSFSKTMLPLLRVGFLVAPSSLQAALRTAKQLSDWAGDVTTQAALARFLDEGMLARHIRRTIREYAVRRDEIIATIGRDLVGLLEVVPSAAGMHLCARAVPGATVAWSRVVERVRADGVVARSLAGFYAGTSIHNGLVLGFGAIPRDRVGEGMRRLVAAVRR